MPSVGLIPALPMLAGAALFAGTGLTAPPPWLLWVLTGAGWIAWCCVPAGQPRHASAWTRLTMVMLGSAFACTGALLAGDATERALYTPLRALLDREVGGFRIDTAAAPLDRDVFSVRAVIEEDAMPRDGFTSLRVRVVAVNIRDTWVSADGGVILTVGGRPPPGRIEEWRAGRTIETFAAFRRPATYLNEGVPDFERDLALDGTTLLGSVKSALLVDVRHRGAFVEELSARVRQSTRERVERQVGRHDPVAASIVTAILIGDRTGLPDDVRLRLQEAGTYHVIAISGGNIAILAGLAMGVLVLCGVTGRPAALATLIVLVAYAHVVTAEPSVWRATLMAVLYLSARLLGLRSPTWQAMSVAALLVVAVRPLDVQNVGFLLTFGATSALIEVARRASGSRRWPVAVRWPAMSVAASAAVELALLPVSAHAFSRVTSAGLVLNLAAVPLMTVVQVGGMAAVALDGADNVAAAAGWVSYLAAKALVSSAGLVEAAPWLTVRVPPPGGLLVASYYLALAAALVPRRLVRVPAAAVLAVCIVAMTSGTPLPAFREPRDPSTLRFTMFDVGQGESMLLESAGSTLLVDAGGVPFGGGGFDVGARVLAPALWARGVRRLDGFLFTHGDPDHVGGATAVLDDFRPRHVWYGIPVPSHRGLGDLLAQARHVGSTLASLEKEERVELGRVRLRVLHPEAADWERPRVRNDDSVVLEVVHGDVAMLLLGDAGAGVERMLLPQLTHAGLRILKVAHHGSRTSTSPDLVEAWRPQIAIISAGRGNSFGHPAPEVLRRLEAIGAAIYRTDRDGQVTIESDGHGVSVRTYRGRAGPYVGSASHR